MSKKTYFAPTFMVASGGIDITQSQEGVIGGGDVQTDFISYLLDGGLTDEMLTWAYEALGSAPQGWNLAGFDYGDDKTWEIALNYIADNYPYY